MNKKIMRGINLRREGDFMCVTVQYDEINIENGQKISSGNQRYKMIDLEGTDEIVAHIKAVEQYCKDNMLEA